MRGAGILAVLVAASACHTPSAADASAADREAVYRDGATATEVRAVRPGTGAEDPGWRLERVPGPASRASASPQLTATGDRILLSWLDLSDEAVALRFSEWTGGAWSGPTTVRLGEDMVVNGVDVPSVRALPDGALVAHWLEMDGFDPESYKLPLSWSRDAGATWSEPAYPHHDTKQVQHGFASIYPMGAGFGVVWLDGRNMTPEQFDDPTAAMGLWAATFDGRGTQQGEQVVDTRVCECCPLSSAETDRGVVVVYRGRSQDEVRDIFLTRLESDGWTEPVPVYPDGWQIRGCPVNGPAVSARGSEVVVAWFTAANDEGTARIAFSHDGGGTFEAPIRVDDGGSLGEVDVELLEDGGAAVTWIELSAQRRSMLRRIAPDGTRSPALEIADLSRAGAARLAHDGGTLLLAWPEVDDDGAATVQTARVALH